MHLSKRSIWASVALLAVAIVALAPQLIVGAGPGPLAAHFIDVGQGDSCWPHLPNGDDALIDGPPSLAPTPATRACRVRSGRQQNSRKP